MSKFISFCLVLILMVCFVACGKVEDTVSEDTTAVVEQKIEYEKVSRPIKEFWLYGDYILVLTEDGELFCGEPNTANPVFVVGDVKDVEMSDDCGNGLILLNDGKVLPVNNHFESQSAISIPHELLYYGTIQNFEEKVIDASAESLFNYYLFYNKNDELCNVKGDVLLNEKVKDGFLFSYGDNAGLSFSGVFLFPDGTVKHCRNDGVREIANDVAKLYCISDGTIGTYNRCCIIKNNGDLLCWDLDTYSYEDTPLNPVNRVAENANPNFDVYSTGDYVNYGSCVLYVNNDNDLMIFSFSDNSSQKLYSNIKEVYYRYDALDVAEISPFAPVVLTQDNKLIATKNNKVIAENVIDVLDNGKFIIYDDYSCGRLDGNESYVHRLDNVLYADSYGLQVEFETQVFLKHGGALYASNGYESTVYKTAFCEKTLRLNYNGQSIIPKQSIQIKNNEPMLPYDECCSIFDLLSSFDTINNSVIIENNESKIEFFVDSNNIKINEKQIKSQSNTYKDSDGLIWIPIKYVAETFGYDYNFDDKSYEITIVSKTVTLLTEDDIKQKLFYACKLYDNWLDHGWAVKCDYDQTINENSMEYHPVIPTDFISLDELENELRNHFAESVYSEILSHNYLVKDGVWYVITTIGQGGDFELIKLDLEILSSESNKCSFTVTSHYKDTDETYICNYTLELINDKWIFTEYSGTLGFFTNDNPEWI